MQSTDNDIVLPKSKNKQRWVGFLASLRLERALCSRKKGGQMRDRDRDTDTASRVSADGVAVMVAVAV